MLPSLEVGGPSKIIGQDQSATAIHLYDDLIFVAFLIVMPKFKFHFNIADEFYELCQSLWEIVRFFLFLKLLHDVFIDE